MKDYIIINPIDNVAVCLRPFSKGEVIEGVTLLEDIPQAHKVALKDINEGEDIIKYGNPIGHATAFIQKDVMFILIMLRLILMMLLNINMSQIIQMF